MQAHVDSVHLRLAVGDAGDGLHRGGDVVAAGDGDLDDVAANAVLQLIGGACRDDLSLVDDDDLVGELVGLLEVLRGEQQRGTTSHQRADDVPHPVAAARVETGRGLVEEQHLRCRDEAARQV